MPGHYESSPPASDYDVHRLQNILDSFLLDRLQEDPHLSEIGRKLVEITHGNSFSMDPVWLHPSDHEGQSLLEITSKRPVGSATAAAAARWRRNHQTKAARGMLHLPEIAAFANNYNQFVRQEDVGTPRPPSLRDSVRSPKQMEEALIEHAVSFLSNAIGRIVTAEEYRHNHGTIVWLFAAHKPEDLLHLDPRFVLNLVKVNEPIQRVHRARKFGGGAEAARHLVQQDDLGFAMDLKKGYNQVAQHAEMSRRQRYLLQAYVVDRACDQLKIPRPDRSVVQMFWCQGEACFLLEPTCLQFGHTLSRELFQKRVNLMTNELAQRCGIRSVTQVDDVLILNRRGPAATYIDLLVTIATFEHYRFTLHLSEKKAAQLWPQAFFTFDGALIVPEWMQWFSIEEQVQRHQKELDLVRADLGKRQPRTTLKQLARVCMQQHYHKRHHWPTALLMPHPLQFLADEQRRLRKRHGADDMWQQCVQPPARTVLDALELLAEPKEVGEYLRVTGKRIVTLTYDASSEALGFEFKDHRSGKKTSGSIPMAASERTKHHTPQELQAAMTVVLGHVRALNLVGTNPKHPDVVQVNNDNTAAVRNLTRPGSKPSMVDPQIDTRTDLRNRNIVIVGGYASKHYMDVTSQCDWNSRRDLRYPEWMLCPQTLHRALNKMGESITVDLMASRTTAQCPVHVSRHPEPEAAAVDALQLNWARHPRLQRQKLYCFPPPILADRITAKVIQHNAELILVLPLWSSMPASWPDVRSRTTKAVVIAPSKTLCRHPTGQAIPAHEVPSWPLILLLLSPKPSETKQHQQSLSISSEDLTMPSSDDFQTSWSGQTIAQAANRILGAGPGSYETT